MAYDCIPKALSNLFYVYGKFLARHPLPFLICPIVLTGLLMAGMMRLEATSDAEYLYAPSNGPSKDERSYFRKTFPTDDNGYFSSLRRLSLEGFLHVHIEDKNSRNVLNNDAVEAIFELNDFILNFKAKYKGDRYNYSDVCATWNGACSYNGILEILDNVTDVTSMDISYPFHTIPNYRTVNLIQELGGVDVESGIVQSARAIQLSYFVRWDNSKAEKTSLAWMDGIRDKLLKYKDSDIDVNFETALSLEQELEDSVGSIIPLFTISYTVLALFAVTSCLMADWVRAKPWVALAGLVAAALGTASSLGLMSACGVKFASVVGTMPFLIIGIGLDDMFILVSSWRYTSYKLSVEERTGAMLKNAAVSITITSVTDALAFGIGCLTPFRSITIFCAYTGVAVLFVYIYMITFTTACMVYSGRREEANKHPFTCRHVIPKDDAEQKSKKYQICCAGGSYDNYREVTEEAPESNLEIGIGKKQPLPPISNKGHTKDQTSINEDGLEIPFMNKFLGTKYASALMTIYFKIGVILVYLAMLGSAIYGIMTLEEGLDRSNLAPDGSYFRDYFSRYTRDFLGNYGPIVHVGFDKSLDYTSQSVRDNIDDIIDEFRDSKYFVSDEEFVISWLDDFEAYLNETGNDINSLSMPDFISNLRNNFFNDPRYQYYFLDVDFNGDFTAIRNSRVFVQSKSLDDAVDELSMMTDAREIADKSKYNVEVFAPPFIFYDQYDVIAINTVQNIGIAIACMAVVAIVLIPSITTIVWVTLATMSICACVVGFMSHWDVSLDSVSMINLIMCIGFSVDFAAHISYHFVVAESINPNESAKEALGYLGWPIIQGFLSTLLGVLALAASNTYIFRTFFKLVFLVMVFGFFHAMFLLPVLLSTINCYRCTKKKTVDKAGDVSPAHSSSQVELGQNNEAFQGKT